MPFADPFAQTADAEASVELPSHGAAPDVMAVEARGVACRRGGRLLFSGLDLTLAHGELVWLRGDNGRGKTSLLRILAGVATAEAGDVFWGGRPARGAAAALLQPAYVAHANALKDDLTAVEALMFLAEISAGTAGNLDRARSVAALERLGVSKVRDVPVRALSQGQRRRVALARLALLEPGRTWLLDEPYDALDRAATRSLDALLAAHVDAGGSVVLTNHQALPAGAPRARTFWLGGEPAPDAL